MGTLLKKKDIRILNNSEVYRIEKSFSIAYNIEMEKRPRALREIIDEDFQENDKSPEVRKTLLTIMAAGGTIIWFGLCNLLNSSTHVFDGLGKMIGGP